jgi:hypothetical protein
MNEKIKELWDQAASASAAYPSGLGNSWDTQVAFIETLVRLVAQDCIDKIETYRIPVGNSASGELACEWTYDALKEIRDDIKESFGIVDA